MEMIVDLFILLFAFIFLVILPIWFNRYLGKKKFGWKIRILSFMPILIALVLIYFSFYPTNSHYKEIYKQVTKNDFPENAQFISTYSADPTIIEGWTLMMIKLDKKHYINLKSQLKNFNYELETPNDINNLRGLFDVKDFFKLRPDLQIDSVLSSRAGHYVYYGVAFMSDGETIIVKKII